MDLENIQTSLLLKDLTTMRMGGAAKYLKEIHTPQEARYSFIAAKKNSVPIFVLGGGSNLVAKDEGYSGLVLKIAIPGFEIIDDNPNNITIKIGAGENWDSVVKRTVDMNLSGIETLSAIPGTAGAAPVQNIGAYGQEIGETLVSLEAYDTVNDTFVTLNNLDCGFSYRHSIFRGEEAGRYIITSITLKLSKTPLSPPFYDALELYFSQHAVNDYLPQTIRNAVVAIRADKLPDPAVKPSAGSFFKNAIIESWQLNKIKLTYPDIKSYEMAEQKYKISTGWLIEKAGFKGRLLHGIRVHQGNALVLVNETGVGYLELSQARDEIIKKVRDIFGVEITQEPLEI